MRGLFLPQPHDLSPAPDPGPSIDPGTVRLLAAAPNPFRASTDLRFALPVDSQVSLEVYDVTGRLVASPVRDERYPAGPHAVSWDGRDASGRPVASGVYFLRIRAGSATANGKILRLR